MKSSNMTTVTSHVRSLCKQDYKNYLQKGVSYLAYKHNMAENLAQNADVKVKDYIHLNQRRMARVEKTYRPSPGMIARVKSLKHKIYWLVLTEHWCGDASQSLPALNTIAELSQGMIELKLIYRDQSDGLMNAYLTNDTRSIPKLIQLDEDWNVTGIWGPRPARAQEMVKELKSNAATAAHYANELHFWYAKNKQQDLEKEMIQLLDRAGLVYPDCLS